MSSMPGALVVFRNYRASATSSEMLIWLNCSVGVGRWFAGGRMKSLTVNTELK